jgi:MoaA/NifB/PqqE/SkfB family radical SAM enzyme
MIIDFNITNYCNAKCPSCKRFDVDNYLQTERNLRVEHMDFNSWKKVVEKNQNLFKDMICYFCGEFGDPLMHPKIKDFCEVGSNIFKEVVIYTNGGVNRPDLINYIKSTDKNIVVRFGIDGLTEEINNKYRINVNTNLAYNNMFNLSSVNKARWDYTIFEHNLFEISNVIALALKHRIPLMLRFNLRPSRFGVNRISFEDVITIRKLMNDYRGTTDLINFDDFWVDCQ